jgi:hypothetical protein
MKTLIDKLIEDAGFSKTYEHDRLRLLVQLTAQYCIDKHTQYMSEYKSSIVRDFDLKEQS